VVADRAYSHRSTRAELRRRGFPHTIPEKSDQRAWRTRQGSRGGRPPVFDREAYRQRNVVERCFNRLKQNRALAARYAKRAALYRALVVIAAIRIWLK
jgi:transposase